MAKKARAFEQGHTRKLLVITDEIPEVYCALFYAARRVQHAGGRIQLLYVIEFEPENQFWEGVRQAQLEEQTNKARALFRLFRRELINRGFDGVELLRSKASQEKPVTIAVDRQHNPRKFAALERWIEHAQIMLGTALFRRIHPRGGVGARITGDGVNRAVKTAALVRYYLSTGVSEETAKRLATHFSGQSGRVGFVVAGAADTAIAATTRHKSLQMIKRYGETADQLNCAPHQLKGVGL